MSEGLHLYRKGEAGARAKIAENMNGYINLLRNHIGKENNILFRMADNVLNESDNNILLNKFSEVEEDAGALETYIALIDKLGVKYLKS
jgi:hemerythrin-like domain-containing protein